MSSRKRLRQQRLVCVMVAPLRPPGNWARPFSSPSRVTRTCSQGRQAGLSIRRRPTAFALCPGFDSDLLPFISPLSASSLSPSPIVPPSHSFACIEQLRLTLLGDLLCAPPLLRFAPGTTRRESKRATFRGASPLASSLPLNTIKSTPNLFRPTFRASYPYRPLFPSFSTEFVGQARLLTATLRLHRVAGKDEKVSADVPASS